MTREINVASLFTGAGGLDIGFNNLDEFKVISHLDKDGDAISTLKTNADDGEYIEPDSMIIEDDIQDYIERESTDVAASQVDFVIGGPPCQPFSAAARRTGGIEGVDNEDGKLFEAYVKLLDRWEPQGFLFENVPGIISDEEGWDMITNAFNEEGYKVFDRTLDAADYGVPQHRVRAFIVGIRKELNVEYEFPLPTHGPDSNTDRDLVSAGEALEELDQSEVSAEGPYEITSKHAHLLEDIPPGLNYSYYTKKMGADEPVFAWRSRFSDYLYKADPGKPVRTLKAHPGAASGPFHWENRKFTEEELKRLQSFPENYEIKGTYNKVVKQIGNSVPPQEAEVLAKSIAQQLFGVKQYDVQTMTDDHDLNFRSRRRTSFEERREKARKWRGDNEPGSKRSSNQKGLEEISQTTGTGSEPVQEIDRSTWSFQSYFDYEELSYGADIRSGNRMFDVETCVRGDTLHISIDKRDERSSSISLGIDPENGVWSGIQDLQVEADAVNLSDIFYIWKIASENVIDLTRYDKFMDVVGHYSTSRMDYTTTLDLEGLSDKPEARALKVFSRTDNCNKQLTLGKLTAKLEADGETVIQALKQLRNWRYEIRTTETHPTMPEGKVLCTYPFPDLNERSHFKENVSFESLLEATEKASLWQQ